jgi:hypothetical protein
MPNELLDVRQSWSSDRCLFRWSRLELDFFKVIFLNSPRNLSFSHHKHIFKQDVFSRDQTALRWLSREWSTKHSKRPCVSCSRAPLCLPCESFLILSLLVESWSSADNLSLADPSSRSLEILKFDQKWPFRIIALALQCPRFPFKTIVVLDISPFSNSNRLHPAGPSKSNRLNPVWTLILHSMSCHFERLVVPQTEAGL